MSNKHSGATGAIRELVTQALGLIEEYKEDSSDNRFHKLSDAKELLTKRIPKHPGYAAFVNRNGEFHHAYLQLVDFVHSHEGEDPLMSRFLTLRRSSQPNRVNQEALKLHLGSAQGSSTQSDQHYQQQMQKFSEALGSTPPDKSLPYPLSPQTDRLRMPLPPSSPYQKRPPSPPKKVSLDEPNNYPGSSSTLPHKRMSVPRAMGDPQQPLKETGANEISPTILKNKLSVSESVLLLDVRMHNQYELGHIRGPFITCLEPTTLRPGISVQDIQDTLVIAPESEADSFERAKSCELVVIYDDHSTSMALSAPLSAVFQALAENRIHSYVLRGGYKAWIDLFPNDVEPRKPQVAIPVPPSHSLATPKPAPPRIPPKQSLEESLNGKADPQATPSLVNGIGASAGSQFDDSGYRKASQYTDPAFNKGANFINANANTNYPNDSNHSLISEASSDVSFMTPGAGGPTAKPPPPLYNPYIPRSSSLPQGPPPPIPKAVPVIDREYEPPADAGYIDESTKSPAKTSAKMPLKVPSLRSKFLSNTTNFGTSNGSSGSSGSAFLSGPSSSQALSNPEPTRFDHTLAGRAFKKGDTIPYVEEQVPPHLLPMTGLKNLGNSCYMNCIIQCLIGVPQLVEPFSNGTYKQYINYNSRLGYKGQFANAFAMLVMQMMNPHAQYIEPMGMKQLSAHLRPDSFAGFEQQDCQEFLTFVLDGLHEDLNSNGDKPKQGALDAKAEERREQLGIRTASAIEWERYLSGDTSLIVDFFQGQYLSQLQCLTCKHTSTTYNSFSSLSLPIASPKLLGQHTSLKTCFDEFVKPEVLDGDNAWNCPHCRRKRKTVKTLQISRLPPILVIHLKRFKRSAMGGTTKLETPVDYPLRNLDLTKYWPQLHQDYGEEQMNILSRIPTRGQYPPFIYDLRAVTLHHGSLRGGHYTAVVQKPGRGWFYFDDSSISQVKEQAAVSKHAYVLVYKRRM